MNDELLKASLSAAVPLWIEEFRNKTDEDDHRFDLVARRCGGSVNEARSQT